MNVRIVFFLIRISAGERNLLSTMELSLIKNISIQKIFQYLKFLIT